MCMSIRSSRGPEMRLHVLLHLLVPSRCSGRRGGRTSRSWQGFMAHTSMNRLGSVRVPAARVMVTTPSSSGWRSASSTSTCRTPAARPETARRCGPGRSLPAAGRPAAAGQGRRRRRCGGGCGRAGGSPAGGPGRSAPRRSRCSVVCQGLLPGSCPAGWRAAAGPAWTCPRRGSRRAGCCGRPAAAISSARLTFSWPMTSGEVRAGAACPPAAASTTRQAGVRLLAPEVGAPAPDVCHRVDREPARPAWPRRRCPPGRYEGVGRPCRRAHSAMGSTPRHRPQRAGEGQLPQKGRVLRQRAGHLARGGQDPHQDGQVVDACPPSSGRRGPGSR